MTTVSTPSQKTSMEHVVQCYGDLLFDLCESILWSPVNAQFAFRAILKDAKRKASADRFTHHERAWILRIACEKLRLLSVRHGRRLTPAEQIELDSTPNVSTRLKQFDQYFHRLATDDQLLLLLRDKYGLPYAEIAAAMALPEGSLRVRRQQALRTLEEWLWNENS